MSIRVNRNHDEYLRKFKNAFIYIARLKERIKLIYSSNVITNTSIELSGYNYVVSVGIPAWDSNL